MSSICCTNSFYFCSLFLRAQGRVLPGPTPPSTYSLWAWNKWKLIPLVRNLKLYRKIKKWKYKPLSLLLPTSCTFDRCSNTRTGADTWFLSPCPQHGQFCMHSSKTTNKHKRASFRNRHCGMYPSLGIYLQFNMQGRVVHCSLLPSNLRIELKKKKNSTNKQKLPQVLLPRYSFLLTTTKNGPGYQEYPNF